MKKKRNNPFDKQVYRSLMMVSQFGINMIVPIAMMCALGVFLDRKLGTSFITVLFFFIGAIAGGQNVYRMAKKLFETPERDWEKVDYQKNKENDKKDSNHAGNRAAEEKK